MSVARSEKKGIVKQLIKFQFQVNLELAISQPNQMSSLRRNEPDELELVISLLIELLVSSLNTTNTMNSNQIDECSLLIIEKYWMLRPEEIMLVFKNAKLGKYGPDYNRIDIATICRWIDQYIDSERTPFFERRNSQQKPDILPKEEFDKMYAAEIQKNIENPDKFKQESKIRREKEDSKKRAIFEEAEKEAAFEAARLEYYKNRKAEKRQVAVAQ